MIEGATKKDAISQLGHLNAKKRQATSIVIDGSIEWKEGFDGRRTAGQWREQVVDVHTVGNNMDVFHTVFTAFYGESHSIIVVCFSFEMAGKGIEVEESRRERGSEVINSLFCGERERKVGEEETPLEVIRIEQVNIPWC